MKVVVGSNEEISKLIAEVFIKQVQNKPNSVLGLATGTSLCRNPSPCFRPWPSRSPCTCGWCCCS